MVYVTSDLHGRMDCLLALLDHVRFGEDEKNWLYILGDVIDRHGCGGVDILKWLLVQPNVQLILGNHEQMMLSARWLFEEISEESIAQMDGDKLHWMALWQTNGGDVTMAALSREDPAVRGDILAYLEDCPLYDAVEVGGRTYLLVHSGLGNFAPGKRMREYTPDELLWERPPLDTAYDPARFTVIFGHTPTGSYGSQYRGRMIRTESFWNIDTGAAGADGRPMLLCLDTGCEYYLDEAGAVIERGGAVG